MVNSFMSYTNLRLQESYVIDDIIMIYVLLQTLSKTSPLVKKRFINKVQWKHECCSVSQKNHV